MGSFSLNCLGFTISRAIKVLKLNEQFESKMTLKKSFALKASPENETGFVFLSIHARQY